MPSESQSEENGSVSGHADVGVVEVRLCSLCLPGGVTQSPQQEKLLVSSSFQQGKTAIVVWVEGRWVVLLGRLGNTAFM